MRVASPPASRACEVCYTPVLVSDRPRSLPARCPKHVDWTPRVPQLRSCPECGQPTFRVGEACSRCDPAVPPLRAERVSKRRERRKPRSARSEAVRTGPNAARSGPRKQEAAPRRNGELLDPDEPRLDRARAHGRGNRTQPGRSVSQQTPARDKALLLMAVPGEWEVLARYQSPGRVKAAVWYLRNRVGPTLPAGRWEFKRCWWERAAVMGRWTPPER